MYRETLIGSARVALRAALVCAFAWASIGVANADEDKPGLFEVRSAEANVAGDQRILDARLQYILSSEALEALQNGIGLNFVIDVEVIESRRFWIDNTIVELRIPLQLQYHALSQRYLVRNLMTDEQESFATLYSALNNLGRITDQPLIETARLRPDRNYRARIRSLLSFEDFSGVWRRMAFWLDEWHLKSDWFEWSLEP